MSGLKTLSILSLLLPALCFGEQKVDVAGYEIHYIIIPTTFLRPDIADQYEISRGRDRALVNVSVLDSEGTPVNADVSGESKNLLSQIQTLEFVQVSEPPAIYYLAELRHADEELHRVSLQIILPDGTTAPINFQQKMYWKH
jgi:hypothetical protein